MSLVRRLAYRDRYVWELSQTISGGSSELPPVQFVPDVSTPFLVSWTQNQWEQVFSALMNGADLTYPEQSHEVVWHLLKMVEYPVAIAYPGDTGDITVTPPNFSVINGNALVFQPLPNQFMNGTFIQSPATNGQSLQFHRLISRGAWSYRFTVIRHPQAGNVNFIVKQADNSVVEDVTLGFYAALTTYNQYFTGSFTVDTDGFASFTMTTTSAGLGGGFRADWSLFEAWRTS